MNPPPAPAGRMHFMDSLRGVLMALGVALHAAMAYDTGRQWVVSDAAGHPGFGVLVTVIHLYRMPLFFIVSGYFTALLHARYSASDFWRSRLLRIVVPFFATLLTANTLLIFAFEASHMRTLTVAHWVGPLWFLAYLFIYLSLFGLAMRGADVLRVPAAWAERACSSRLRWPALLAVFLTAFVAVRLVVKAFNLWDTVWLGFIDASDFLDYGVYFATGLLMSRSRALFDMLTRSPAVIGLAALASLMVLLGHQHLGRPSLGDGLLHHLVHAVAVLFGAVAIMAAFRTHCDVDSPRARFFSEASYTIYLLHGPFLVGFAALLVHVAIPAVLKYVVLVAVTLGCTLALHAWVIARIPLLTLLFNGKIVRKSGPKPEHPAA